MFPTIYRVLVIFLSVKYSFVHASAHEVDNGINFESHFYDLNLDGDSDYRPDMYEPNVRSIKASLRKYALNMDSVEKVENLITLYIEVIGAGDLIRYHDLQQLSERKEKTLQEMKDDSRLLEYLLRYKILTILMDQAEQFVDDIDVAKLSDLKWIPGKINDLRSLLNDLKNKIWWVRKVNVMEFVQNIHKLLMRILVTAENISQLSSSSVIEMFLSKVRHFVQYQVNNFLDAAY